jgi:hypothetical protein
MGGIELILHIGDAKCGSSSIQASLYKARKHLLSLGILYHAPGPSIGHFCYITLIGGTTRGDNSSQRELAKKNLSETRSLIHQHRPRYIILSSENFFSVNPQKLTKLAEDLLGQKPASIHILSFLRHPAPLYLSTVQQALKASHWFPSPASYRRNTASTFVRWKAEPLCKSITVRLFDRKRLIDRSVVAEFQHYLRCLTGTIDIGIPGIEENISLSSEQTIVLQDFRKDFLANFNNKFCPESSRIIRFFENINATFGTTGTRAALKNEVKACIIQQNIQFMNTLDNLFPGLDIAKTEEQPQTLLADVSGCWTENVSSILESYDPILVQKLKVLIPEYNEGLAKGNVRTALNALTSLHLPRRSYSFFRSFLEASDLLEASRAVEHEENY